MDVERRKEIIDGDAKSAILYLSAKQDIFSLLYFKYDVDENNKLRHLFCADLEGHVDCELYRDVLMFDTTYMTNVYKKPLVIFCGINNNFLTCVFACKLL